MDYAKKVGRNIRAIRISKRMSIGKLADNISALGGKPVSGAAVQAWELGKNEIKASQLHYCALALGVTEQKLFTYEDDSSFISSPGYDRFIEEADALPQAEKDTMIYALTKWSGNVHALLQFNSLYMNMDKHYRADIAGMGVFMYKKAKAEGHLVDESAPIDINYIEEEWEKLMKK